MNLFKMKYNYEPHPMKWWHFPLLIILIAGTIFIIVSQNKTKNKWQFMEGNVFGTTYHVSYKSTQNLNDSILDVLNDVDRSLSIFNDSSVISHINQNKSNDVDWMFLKVFNKSQHIYDETNGAFDITVAPLVNAWGFGFQNASDIDSIIIDSILTYVGMDKVHLKESELLKDDNRIMLDCSAIAKGFGVDMVSEMLTHNDVKDFMVEIGGEVRTRGKNDKSGLWRIGINEPTDDMTASNDNLQNIIEISDMSIATSGNYRNYYIKNNKKYAHTIDPHTGYPVQHSILSSTVLSKDCMTADAYATAFMVLGLEKSKEILKSHSELQAYFIYSNEKGDNEVWHSDGLLLENE